MKKLALLATLVFSVMFSSAKAEVVLYCQTELATGFAKKNGSWKEAKFKLRRYSIKFSDDYKELFFPEDDDLVSFKCRKGYSHDPNFLVCTSRMGPIYLFHKNTRRYLLSKPSSGGC